MTANWPSRAVAVITILASVTAAAVGIAQGTATGSSTAVFAGVVVAYLMAGVLVIERRPGNAVGPILLSMALMVALYAVANLYIRQPDRPAGADLIAWVVSLLDAPLFALVAILFLVFPDGHHLSPRWRWVTVASLVCAAAVNVGTAVRAGPFAYYADIDNPFGVPGSPVVEVRAPFYLLINVIVGLAALSLVGRWRRGGPVERAQLKWVASGAALIAIVMALYAILVGPGTYSDFADLAAGIPLGIFPVAIGIAILRYRLFEIDRIISRTIAYGLITAILVTTYAIVILVLQASLGAILENDSTIQVALSTLVVAGLFQPIRRRVQRVVDGRFDRARIDADRTTAAFSERLRDEVDIETVTADLRNTVRATIRPHRLGVWLREVGR